MKINIALARAVLSIIFASIIVLGVPIPVAAQTSIKSPGIRLFEKGDLTGSIEALKDSNDVVDLHFLATAYERMGREKEARNAFDRSFRRGYEEFADDLVARSRFDPKQPAPVEKLSPFLERFGDRVVVTGQSAARTLALKGASSKENEWAMRAQMFAEIARILAKNEMIFSRRELDLDPKVIEKPRPRYTDAARSNNEQGSVELLVLYGADGLVKAAWPVKPLRHGLTEQTYLAANKMKFTPGQRAGKPVATLGIVSYSFTIY